MIKKIKPSKSEKIIFIFLIFLAITTFGTFFIIKNKVIEDVHLVFSKKDKLDYRKIAT